MTGRVTSHLPLARHVAYRALARCGYHQRMELDDMYHDAVVALIKADRQYDPDNQAGAKFSTYAYKAMQRAVRRGRVMEETIRRPLDYPDHHDLKKVGSIDVPGAHDGETVGNNLTGSTDEEERQVQSDIRRRVRRAVGMLPRDMQDVVVLSYGIDRPGGAMSVRQIGTVLGKSHNAVWKRLKLAQDRLTPLLRDVATDLGLEKA